MSTKKFVSFLLYIAVCNSAEVCYENLGCFPMTYPWSYLMRPIPDPEPLDEIPVYLHLYTSDDINTEYIIDCQNELHIEETPFNASRPTVIVAHGTANNITSTWIYVLRDVYLSKRDANYFVVNWGQGSNKQFFQAISNMRVNARGVVAVLQYLYLNHGLQPEDIHLIGLGVGAHFASYIAKEFPGVGRLTAFDPAVPLFDGYDESVRLHVSDANFIDVLFTFATPAMGKLLSYGHVEFFFNGGGIQPGCHFWDKEPLYWDFVYFVSNPYELKSRRNPYRCTHERAAYYFIEALNKTFGCAMWGHKLGFKELMKTIAHSATDGGVSNFSEFPCTPDTCIPVGFDTVQSQLRGNFVVWTNKNFPYCIEETGPDQSGQADESNQSGCGGQSGESGQGDRSNQSGHGGQSGQGGESNESEEWDEREELDPPQSSDPSYESNHLGQSSQSSQNGMSGHQSTKQEPIK